MIGRFTGDDAPARPARAPDLGSAAANALAAEIWTRAVGAGLSPVDRLTFEPSTDREATGRLRFQMIDGDPMVVRRCWPGWARWTGGRPRSSDG